MLCMHLSALAFLLAMYGLLYAACFGWGQATIRLLGCRDSRNGIVTQTAWIGWAASLFILQVLHFVLPINASVAMPVFAAGIVFATPAAIRRSRRATSRFWRSRPFIVVSSALIVISAWVASRAMLPPLSYDSGLYHFNKIRWITSYPLVPGLGNLHGRLAFNQSFFTYAAALDFAPLLMHGRSIANSFLFLLTTATFIESLAPLAGARPRLVRIHPFRYPAFVAFPVLAYLALSSDGLSSPSPDLTSTLLQLAMFVRLVQGLEEWNRGERRQTFNAVFLCIMAATAVTIKLSNLAFSAVIGVFVVLYAISSNERHSEQLTLATKNLKNAQKNVMIRAFSFCSIVILIWCAQSLILSGAPLFPSTIGYIPFDWAVPKERIVEEANWIYSSARSPGMHWRHVLGNWSWLKPWLYRLQWQIEGIVIPLSAAALFLLIMLIRARFFRLRRSDFVRLWEPAILAPAATSLIYWFFTAPDQRFAHGSFFILSTGSGLLLLSFLWRRAKQTSTPWTVWSILAIANLSLWTLLVKQPQGIASISVSGWHKTTVVAMDTMRMGSGLTLHCPRTGDQCWDSPLPSTPYPDEQIRLRDSTRMASGFTRMAPRK